MRWWLRTMAGGRPGFSLQGCFLCLIKCRRLWAGWYCIAACFQTGFCFPSDETASIRAHGSAELDPASLAIATSVGSMTRLCKLLSDQRLLLQSCSFVLAGGGACSILWRVNNLCTEPQAYVQLRAVVQLTNAVLMHPGYV